MNNKDIQGYNSVADILSGFDGFHDMYLEGVQLEGDKLIFTIKRDNKNIDGKKVKMVMENVSEMKLDGPVYAYTVIFDLSVDKQGDTFTVTMDSSVGFDGLIKAGNVYLERKE